MPGTPPLAMPPSPVSVPRIPVVPPPSAAAAAAAVLSGLPPGAGAPFPPPFDPIYLQLYANPGLYLQSLPPEQLLQLYKNLPQGIPITKS